MVSVYIRAMPITRKCQVCGKDFKTYEAWIRKGGGKTCSSKCGVKARRSYSGEGNPRWLGGRRPTKRGYIRVSLGNGHRREEHVLIMEKIIGRRLKPGENVHHKNEIRSDNRPENLELLTIKEHIMLHGHHEQGRVNFHRINEKRRSK